jgi:hypothetical protein
MLCSAAQDSTVLGIGCESVDDTGKFETGEGCRAFITSRRSSVTMVSGPSRSTRQN